MIKPLYKQAAFSLIELIVVIVLVGILSTLAITRYSSNTDFESRSAAAELMNHVRLAQQLAMNNTSESVEIEILASSVDLRAGPLGAEVSITGYPYSFEQDIIIAPLTTLLFTNEGTTTNTTFALTPSAGVSVCVESSGFAWLC